MNKVVKTISVVKLLKMFSTEHKAVKWLEQKADKERAKYSVCRFMYIIPQKIGIIYINLQGSVKRLTIWGC